MPGYRRGVLLPGSTVAVAGSAGSVGAAVVRALVAAGAAPVPVDAGPGPAGRTRLDGWVQVAGAVQPSGPAESVPLVDLPLTEIRRVLDDDVLGAVHGARAALPLLVAGGGGVLVLVVPLHGQVARPGGAPQSMAGAAVRAMAGALRQELRLTRVRGVAVTAVLAPVVGGPFPAGRPDRIAATVLRRLRRPALETVAGGPLATALVHGHALVPPVSEWLVARTSRLRGRETDRGRGG